MARALALLVLLAVALAFAFVPAAAAPPSRGQADEDRSTAAPDLDSGTIAPDSRTEVEPPQARLGGRVRDDAGHPLAGAEITTTFGVDGAWRELLGSVRSGTAGEFGLDARPLLAVAPVQLPALRVTVGAFLAGHEPAQRMVPLAEALDGFGLELQRLDPAFGHLVGTVRTRDGRPLPLAGIHRIDPPHETYAVSDEHGRFATPFTDEFAQSEPETLYAHHPEHGVSVPIVVRLPRAGERCSIDFVITSGEPQVDGVVLDLDGRCVADVRLRLQLEQRGAEPAEPRQPDTSPHVSSDATGRFVLRGHSPGLWSVRHDRRGDEHLFLDGEDAPPWRTVAAADLPIVFVLQAVPVDFEFVDEHGRPTPWPTVRGTVTPPPGSPLPPATFVMQRSLRMWLPPGCAGEWRASLAGAADQHGTFRANTGHVVVRAVLASAR